MHMKNETLTKIDELESLLQVRREYKQAIDEVEKRIADYLEPTTAKETLNTDTPMAKTKIKMVSVYDEVFSIMQSHPAGLSTDEVFAEYKKRNPDTLLKKSEVTLALVYLKHKRGLLDTPSRGFYKLK